MKAGAILIVGILGLGAAAPQGANLKPSAAEEGLHALVDRQNAIFAAADAAGKDVDPDNVRHKLQDLTYDYEAFLKRNPDYGPAFAAYGIMLGRIEMRTESTAILSKADSLLAKEYADESARTPALLKTWATVKNQLGNHVAEEGHPIEAATYFLDAIQLAPKEPLYHYQLGTLLSEARDDFIKGGQWTREKLDKAMTDAFRTASELAPDRFDLAYRYGQSFYDVEKPDWDAALKLWGALEEKASSPLERETIRLQAANVLIKQGKPDIAQAVLATIGQPDLKSRKEELLKQIEATTK